MGIVGALLAAVAWAEIAASPEEETQKLVDAGLAAVRDRLGDPEDQIQPFAFVMRTDGRLQKLSPADDQATPDAVSLLGALQRHITRKAADGEIRASAIFADVVVSLRGAETDALLAGVEHVSGYCRNFYFTYLRTGSGELHVSEAIPASRKGSVFGSCQ